MAIVNPPGWLENSGPINTAQQLRSYIGMLLDMPVGTFIPYGGVHRTAGQRLVVSQTTTPTMDVVVGSGAAIVPGTQNSQQGAYFVINDAPVTLTVSPSEPSLPRIDIVQLRVRDDFYSGVVRDAILDIKKGTPASSPSAPTPDADAIVLAEILVPAGAISISNANITDKRQFFSPFSRNGSALETDFLITSERPNLSDDGFAVKRPTEANNRWKVKIDGTMWWGPGASTQDTNLYRDAPGVLKTDGSFIVNENLEVFGDVILQGSVSVPPTKPLPGTCVARLRRTSSSTVALENPIPWDAEDWDTLGAHASGSSSYVPTVAGKYRVTAIVITQPIGSGSALITRIRKNGNVQSTVTATSNSSPSTGNGWMISDVVQCNGTSDSIDVTVSNNAGAAVNAAGSVLTITYEGP